MELSFNERYLGILNNARGQQGDSRDYVRVFFDFRASSIMEGATEVRGEGFSDHLARDKPSGAPGIDIDVSFQTEGLANGARPTVRSPVSGVRIPSSETYGTVRIRDKNGWEHRFLHMRLDYENPLPGRIFPLGDYIEKGNPIGVLGDVHPKRKIRDHVHYSVITPQGLFADPKKLYFDSDGSVIRYKSFEGELLDRILQLRSKESGGVPRDYFDRVDPPDVSGMA